MFYKICACPSCTCVNITNFPSFFHCHWKCWNTCDSSFVKRLQDYTAPIEKVPRRQEKRLLNWTFQTLKPPSGARNAPDFLFCLFNRGRYSIETSATLFLFFSPFFLVFFPTQNQGCYCLPEGITPYLKSHLVANPKAFLSCCVCPY